MLSDGEKICLAMNKLDKEFSSNKSLTLGESTQTNNKQKNKLLIPVAHWKTHSVKLLGEFAIETSREEMKESERRESKENLENSMNFRGLFRCLFLFVLRIIRDVINYVWGET